MKKSCGHPRKLNDRQIRKVLEWHRATVAFRCAHGTLKELALLLGVSVHAVRNYSEDKVPGIFSRDEIQAPGGRGRPRHLNPAQIAFVTAWRDAGRQFRARHGHIASLARKLGVGTSTIHDCIRRKGRYRQRADTDVTKVRNSRGRRPSGIDNEWRSMLLRAWVKTDREKPAEAPKKPAGE